VDVGQHLVQLAPEGGVHGVHRLGAVHHQVGDVAIGAFSRQGKAGKVCHLSGAKKTGSVDRPVYKPK
jgi:hypothetical protein